MASSLQNTDKLIKQCEQLSQLVSNFNKTIEETIAIASNDMNLLLTSIKQNIEDTTNTMVNDFNEWEHLRRNLSKTQVRGKVLLDIGGRHFSTTVDTLTNEKNTFFTALFSKNWQLEKDNEGRIFIDRNGDLFVEILEFMRNPNEFILPEDRLRRRLINEAKFYKLKSFLEVLTEPERRKEEEEERERQRKAQLFADDTLLTIEQMQKLNELYGKPDQSWKLIYKATRDGFEGRIFHGLCDNQGPTIVIIRSSDGYLFGGYAAQSWNSAGNYTNAPNSFLFLLTNANGSQPTKFPYNNNGHGLYGNNAYGPTFGGGHDLHICDKSNTTNNSYCNMPHSYTNPLGLGQATFTGSRNFQTTEIEVFKLSE
ncbi:unnamed protein product [Rotaria magnacalcarata]|uniref:TLDc domain-containing protein n=1 Tax=Rotaria magnacalcarata TaxID=392030 RepID=A0A814JYM9_9BILA|nr:unnamed protein product [Rotaria magnacalcarata]CAF1368090.1 unnamed protein product [Rotaria magnacalcarata]CAF2096681.1 unnamed protein product [Rotaria magnacalcarata]CAF4000555.1 unnamed protein product [Rotaria magnacalcarata]CAF4051630.1 unnamed protein product [Rotaria magnacalcarata]